VKAITKLEPKRGLGIIEIEEPSLIDDYSVLVQIDAVSICGTDLHLYDWDEWAKNRIKLPRVIGHEGTGRVIKAGKKVEDKFQVGQRVTFESHIPCFECYQCKTNKMHICSNLKLLGIDVDGLFRKYIVVPSFILVPNDLDFDEASILEPLGNAFHALSKVDIRGKYVGILGDGPIALFLFYFAQKFGPSKIFLIGKSEYRMNLAKSLNYSEQFVVNYGENVVDFVRKETGGRMLDVVFEMAGNENTVKLGLILATFGAKFVAFGILPSSINLDYNEIIHKSIDIISVNGRILFDSWFFMLDTIKKGELKRFITHVFDFEDYEKAFELLFRREALKVIIKV